MTPEQENKLREEWKEVINNVVVVTDEMAANWWINKLKASRQEGHKEGYSKCWQEFKDMDPFQLGRQEGVREAREIVEKMETTFGVQQSDSYQIGENHGRQEFKSNVLAALASLTTTENNYEN